MVLRGVVMLTFCLAFIDDFEDEKIFENLFYTYRKQMIYLAMSYLHNQEDAEDVVHDVFLNIAQRHMSIIKNIKNDIDMRNYLLKATKNTAISKIRKNKKIIQSSVPISELIFDDLYSNDFVDKICRDCDYVDVVTGIKSLDEIYRNSLYYHFVLELSIEQVSKILNQSISTTKKQLVRGKKLLLNSLKLEGD